MKNKMYNVIVIIMYFYIYVIIRNDLVKNSDGTDI